MKHTVREMIDCFRDVKRSDPKRLRLAALLWRERKIMNAFFPKSEKPDVVSVPATMTSELP